MDTPPNELEMLLAEVALKRRAAFELIYQKTSPKLFGLLMRILKREDLAQECLQDAYVLIWNRAAEYRSNKAAAFTWMASIARYRALDLLRRRKHEEPLDEKMFSRIPDETYREVESQMILEEDGKRLEECMKMLDPEQRNCIYLAYMEGYTHPEIALRLDAPAGSVKTWIRRGVIRLKECLS